MLPKRVNRMPEKDHLLDHWSDLYWPKIPDILLTLSPTSPLIIVTSLAMYAWSMIKESGAIFVQWHCPGSGLPVWQRKGLGFSHSCSWLTSWNDSDCRLATFFQASSRYWGKMLYIVNLWHCDILNSCLFSESLQTEMTREFVRILSIRTAFILTGMVFTWALYHS